jgi:hypothetical protein
MGKALASAWSVRDLTLDLPQEVGSSQPLFVSSKFL